MDASDVMAALGSEAAGATAGRVRFVVDMREGDHWVKLAGFQTKTDAQAAISRAVEAGADATRLRIRRFHDERSSG
jgi:hypothetical protein